MISKLLSTSEKRAALHQEAGELAEFCQALYPLLLAHADDFGRLQGDVFTVKHAIDPSSPRSAGEFSQALQALDRVGLVRWYEANRRKYLRITHFEKHQQGLHKRTESTFPEPPGNSDDFHELPSELNRTEQKGTEPNGTADAGRRVSNRFDRLWALYPRKVGKDAARREFDKLAPGDDLTDQMAAAIERHKASTQWRKDDGQFIPHLRTWLHNGRWKDELIPEKGPRGGDVTPLRRWDEDCHHEPKCERYDWHQVKLERERQHA